MEKISQLFNRRKTLITYITAGDPSLAATEQLIFALEKAGADIIELGIPFSDPLADGPVIQASHQRALKKNVTLADVFKVVAKARKKTQIPICFMLSYNLIVQYGVEKFYENCGKYGVNGVIVPDLPPEESSLVPRPTSVDSIFLVAPTSTEERIRLAAERSSRFIYLVSVAGITGVRQGIAGDLGDLVNRVRRYTKLPIAIGFGISTPAQAAAAAKLADGVIVGSVIVDLISRGKTKAAINLVAKLRKTLDAL
jgi:tryptophan synthase alpha chain